MGDKFSTGPAFRVHVPVHPFGTDPSQTVKANGQPAPIRQTSTFQWVNRGNGRGLVGRMQGDPANPIEAATATITCVFAQLVMGRHIIRVGKYELRPGIDFLAGASDNDLADNLAAAINALPGYLAPNPAAAAVLISTTAGHADDHRIEVVETAPGSAFVLTATARTGLMDRGLPDVDAPTLA